MPKTKLLSSRSDARTVACPECHAQPEDHCIGKRGFRLACHLERHYAFADAVLAKS